MKKDQIINELNQLISGDNPFTSEKISASSDLADPKIKAFLAEIVKYLSWERPKKDSADTQIDKQAKDQERRQKNKEQGLPERSGFPWTEQEIAWLTKKLQTGQIVDTESLQSKLLRKESAIISKCISLQLISNWAEVEKHLKVSAEIKKIIHDRIVAGTAG